MRALIVSLSLLVSITGCSGDSEDPAADRLPSASPSSAPATASPAPAPSEGACYRLDYTEAVSPTTEASPTACGGRATARTYFVGELDTVVGGHLLAVDADRVQAQVAAACPTRLSRYVGGTPEDLRLSVLRAIWFSPSLEQSDEGQNWYRCDVIAVASDEKLAPLPGRLRGVLTTAAGRSRFALCATAEPGTRAFQRVICSRRHAWRAIDTVDLPGRRWPGEAPVRAAGEAPCEDVARGRADDPLSFTWAYEWPTEKQWTSGMRYGVCWVPER